METLRRLGQGSAWANGRVFAACEAVDLTALDAEAKGTLGSIAATLKHLVGVGDIYLAASRCRTSTIS